MKVVFAGTPEFAAVALAAIHQAGFDIPLVLTQPDRPAGRGMKLQASAVKQFALEHGLPVAQPTSLRLDGKFSDEAKAAQALLQITPHDVMVVAAYGLILPCWALETPRLGCLNIHGSLLPRWRGAAPIHRAIEAGDASTGITIMQMDEGLDTGAMLSMRELAIGSTDTTGSLHDRLAALGAEMIVEILRKLEQGSLIATPQPDTGVCYASKISKEEARLDFSLPASVLERKVRAFNPFPGTHAQYGEHGIKIWRAEALPQTHQAAPGTILRVDGEVIVACGEGCLRLLELQKAGGKRLPVLEFLQGFGLEAGAVIS